MTEQQLKSLNETAAQTVVLLNAIAIAAEQATIALERLADAQARVQLS